MATMEGIIALYGPQALMLVLDHKTQYRWYLGKVELEQVTSCLTNVTLCDIQRSMLDINLESELELR